MFSETELLLNNTFNKIAKATRPAKKLVIPVSGGSDSALIYALLNKVCPEKTIGLHLGSKLRCRDWFASIGHLEVIDPPEAVAYMYDNDAIRWAVALNITLKNGAWLVGSRTRTEDTLGTYSLASRIATYLPIVKVWKTDVMIMCEVLGIPKEIVDSSRQADPDCGRPKEMTEIPLELIDEYLKFMEGLLAATSMTEEQKQYLKGIVGANKFKQGLPLKH